RHRPSSARPRALFIRRWRDRLCHARRNARSARHRSRLPRCTTNHCSSFLRRLQMRSKTPALLASLLIGALFAASAGAQTLVDVVNDATDPLHRTDSEPSIAVNPLDSNEISIIAFPNSWSAATNAPIFKSRDGGVTWTPILQLPTGGPSSTRSLDQKIAYTADGRLLVAQIPDGVGLPDCVIYRQTAVDPDAPLTLGMFYGDDQPH